MQDLRLVGVHDDGEHLLLSGTGGDMYRLRIDEALRVAASRNPNRTPTRSTPAGPATAATRPSPREIQMQIRAGASAADVAEQSGIPLEQVKRYEGPVLAERDHIASQARKVEVSAAITTNDGYRSAFGDNPASLDEMVTHRLVEFGIDPSTVEWDAWRRMDGTWTVTADFDVAAASAAGSIGEPAPAQWTFHAGRKTLHNGNRWAQQLSELEPVDGPVPSRRLAAVADNPFDFETVASEEDDDAVAERELAEEIAAAEAKDASAQSLLEMLRSRRGQRLGLDENEDDALATMLNSGVPAAHPRTSGDTAADESGTAAEAADVDGVDDTAAETELQPARPAKKFPFLSLAPNLPETAEHDLELHHVSTDTHEIRISASPWSIDAVKSKNGSPADAAPAEAATQAAPAPEDAPAPAPAERKTTARPKRSSVPSWDEIVFGTKGD